QGSPINIAEPGRYATENTGERFLAAEKLRTRRPGRDLVPRPERARNMGVREIPEVRRRAPRAANHEDLARSAPISGPETAGPPRHEHRGGEGIQARCLEELRRKVWSRPGRQHSNLSVPQHGGRTHIDRKLLREMAGHEEACLEKSLHLHADGER